MGRFGPNGTGLDESLKVLPTFESNLDRTPKDIIMEKYGTKITIVGPASTKLESSIMRIFWFFFGSEWFFGSKSSPNTQQSKLSEFAPNMSHKS